MKKAMIGMALIMSAFVFSCGIGLKGRADTGEHEFYKAKTKEYQYYVRDGVVEIEKYIGKKKKVTVPEKIEGKCVVSIRNCFYRTSVSSVTVPDSISAMNSRAFYNCKKLKKVKLSKKITTIPSGAFMGCTSLTKVSMSSSVSEIGDKAFWNCGALTSVGDLTLKKIGRRAFENCIKLKGTITLDSSLEKISYGSFCNCKKLSFRFPDKDLTVYDLAFAGCRTISKRYISPNISAGAYAACTNIDTVVVKDDNVIEENGVYYTKDRKTLVYVRPDYQGKLDFLKQVDTIGAYAFSGFRQKKVKIPDTIREIREGAFYGALCKSVTWNKNVKDMANYMFQESALEKVVIPKGVKTIGFRALWKMPKCVSVSLPASVRSWADYEAEFTGVLEGFPALKKVTVASGNPHLKSKKGLLFSKKNRLLCYPAGRKAKTYKIPKNITVDSHAFSNVKNLKVTFRFGSSIMGCFINCKNVRIVLPRSGITIGNMQGDDLPPFENSTNCYALVKKNSYVHKKFKKMVKRGYTSEFAYKVV